MKRQLIEIGRQEHLVECDNPKCDYKVKNPTGSPFEDISSFVNMSCPECGENLLTIKDYLQSRRVLKIVAWLNKWFGWLTFFSPKNGTYESTYIKCHDGVKIQKGKKYIVAPTKPAQQ